MSLRSRLLVAMAAVVAMLVLVGVVVTGTTRSRLQRQVDDQVARARDLVGAPAELGAELGEVPGRPRRYGEGTTPPGTLYTAVVDTAGEVVRERLPNTTRTVATPPDLDLDRIRAHRDGAPFTASATGSDLRYRVAVHELRLRDRLVGYAIYGAPLEDADAAVAQLVRVQVIASLAIVAVLGLVTFWVLRLGVRPLKAMTETAAAIGSGDLSRRVPDSAPGTEAGELGAALNQMLGRIEDAFEERTRSEARLRRFVADASHELRTPVTTIRGYAELHRRGGLPTDEAVGDAMRRTEAEAIRMGALVEDLLHLARLDEGRPLQLGPVDLAAVVADSAADAQAVEPDRPITVTAPEPVVVTGDDGQLRQVVANLLANVRLHTPGDAAVELRVARRGSEAVLEVADRGPGMAPEHGARAFERFYRADASRTRHTGGSGLGLAIVAGVAEAHGGRAALDTAPGRGTTVRVVLPVAGPATGR